MKKNILLLILLAFLSIIVIGCGEDKPTPEPDPTPVNPDPSTDPEKEPEGEKETEYTLTVSETSIKLTVGEEKTVTASVTPSCELTWSSSDNSVATVDGGKIKAMKAGKATISVKTSNGKTKVDISVTVEEVAHHEIDDLATLLKNTLDKYLTSSSFNVEITTVNGGATSVMKMIYNKGTNNLYDEFYYEIKGNVTLMTYVKGDTAYMLDETVKRKTTLTQSEKEALAKEYNASEFLSKVSSFYDEAAFFDALEVVNEKEFKLVLNKYNGKALKVDGIDSVTLKVDFSGGYITKVELIYSNGSKVTVNYQGFDHQTITEPNDLSTYTE